MKAVAFLVAVLLGSVLSQAVSVGQDGQDAATLEEWKREAAFAFSLAREDDLKRLTVVRKIAVLEATLVLEQFSDSELTSNNDKEVLRALGVLFMTRGGDSRSLAAVCNKILILRYKRGDESVPLADFIAARVLISIGGRPAREAVFQSLRQPLNRKGLLVRAHVLAEMEPRAVMREYIRLAREEQEDREKARVVRVDETYKNHLRQIDEWLKDPQFLDHPNNWP